MARPTTYKKKFTKYTNAYIKACIEKSEIPYIEELALSFDVDEDTINNWAKTKDAKGQRIHPEFFGAIKRLKTLQKLCLLRASMDRTKATGSIFQLKANHNLIETSRQEHTGKDGEPLPAVNVVFKRKDE